MKFEREVVRFDAVDVITTSGSQTPSGCNPPPNMPIVMSN